MPSRRKGIWTWPCREWGVMKINMGNVYNKSTDLLRSLWQKRVPQSAIMQPSNNYAFSTNCIPSPRRIRVRDSTPELIRCGPPVWVKSRGSSISPTANFSPHMWCQVALSQGSGRPPQTQVESVGCWASLREFVLNLMGGHWAKVQKAKVLVHAVPKSFTSFTLSGTSFLFL